MLTMVKSPSMLGLRNQINTTERIQHNAKSFHLEVVF